MRTSAVLAAAAARLNREAGRPPVPSLYFLTDPVRTPHPEATVRRLPHGSAVIYRHFGGAERHWVARRLARICHRRGLFLLIGADPEMARRVGAAGVHWPERRMPNTRDAEFALVTVAAHSAEAVAAARRAGVDACLLGPIFQTASASGNAPMGLVRGGKVARAAGLPVIALGGIRAANARSLFGCGFAGLAAVEALVRG